MALEGLVEDRFLSGEATAEEWRENEASAAVGSRAFLGAAMLPDFWVAFEMCELPAGMRRVWQHSRRTMRKSMRWDVGMTWGRAAAWSISDAIPLEEWTPPGVVGDWIAENCEDDHDHRLLSRMLWKVQQAMESGPPLSGDTPLEPY